LTHHAIRNSQFAIRNFQFAILKGDQHDRLAYLEG
jgi:hypothetical protein